MLAALVLVAAATAVMAAVVARSDVADLAGLVIVVVTTPVGVLIARAQPRNPVGWLLLGSALAMAVAEAGAQLANAGSPGSSWVAWMGTWTRPVAVYVLLVFVPLHFPDGLPPGQVWRTVQRAAVAVLFLIAGGSALRPGPIQLTDVANPLGLSVPAPVGSVVEVIVSGAGLGMLLAAVVALVHRYRHGGRTQRSQVKWVAYAVSLWLVLVLLSGPAQALDPRLGIVVEVGLLAAGAGLPVAIGIAVLRHRLYDVDLLISRTLVYGTLTVAVVGLYIVAVGYLGALLQARGSLLVSLLATGLVAVVFSPLRERLQRAANRLVYGDRVDPYAALDRLGRRLDAAASPQELLNLAATDVADALRMRYAAVESASPPGAVVVAAHGRPPTGGRLERIRLAAGGGTVGWLAVGPLADGEELSAADRDLLEALSRPVGATLHARDLAAEVQRSRVALVTAREEERARLHRDLHDGLGPELATVSMLAEAARDVARIDPPRAETLLDDLVERAQHAVADLRHVVHALRPPALDALGLVGALRAYAATHTQRGFSVSIDAAEPLPPLPAAVEVAAYRIAAEAITNVARHADARTCNLRLGAAGDRVHLDVVDDGRGLAPDHTPGVGLVSMRTRAAELGGHCTVAARPDGGTVVSAWLPLAGQEPATGELTAVPHP